MSRFSGGFDFEVHSSDAARSPQITLAECEACLHCGDGLDVKESADGRPVDLQSLSMFVDSVTPLLLVAGLADRNTWFPTTELTWHCRYVLLSCMCFVLAD